MTEFSQFSYSGMVELEKLEKNLKNYNKSLISSFVDHAGPGAKNILDFGAGIGTLSNIWKCLKEDSKITCLEVDQTQRSILNNRGFLTLDSLPKEILFDYIFTSNVLEHIENDSEAILKIYNSLSPGGGLESLSQPICFFIQILMQNLGIIDGIQRRT